MANSENIMLKTDHDIRSSNAGFSLIELLIVIAIIGISVGIATFSFNDWNRKSRVESQIKQMAADINEVRIRALTTKQRHSITLNDFSYVFKTYSSETYDSVPDLKAHGTVIPGGTHTVGIQLNKTTTAGDKFTGDILEINERGMLVSLPDTVFLEGGNVGAVNCLAIHTLRTNVGKQTTLGACDVQ